MFKQSERSRHPFLLALAAALLAASLVEIPNLGAHTLANGHAGDTARAAPESAVPQYPVEPFPLSQSGFELISNHLR